MFDLRHPRPVMYSDSGTCCEETDFQDAGRVSNASEITLCNVPDVVEYRSHNRRFADIESRLAAIESSLHNNSTHPDSLWESIGQEHPENIQELSSPVHTVTSGSTIFTASMSRSESQGQFALPRRDLVYALADSYFANYNPAMPLFHQQSFLQMLESWYQSKNNQDYVSWASINVVLALSLQQAPNAATAHSNQLSSECIKNAQSVLNHLVIRDKDIQGLQVVLALVILFLATPRPHPACVLIGTAVRLVHRLKLHIREGRNDTDTGLAAQKEKLLWITYILDRDISMRTTEPYGLQDYDMEVDIPPSALPSYTADGLTLQGDGSKAANIFRLRILLARIQGQMYDLTYSVRARNTRLSSQHEAATDRLTQLLDGWRSSVPQGCRVEDLSTHMPENILRHFVSLHLAYYLCLFMSHRLYARNGAWIDRLMAFRDGLIDGTASNVMSSLQSNTRLLPTNWSSFVVAARSCLSLCQCVGHDQAATLW